MDRDEEDDASPSTARRVLAVLGCETFGIADSAVDSSAGMIGDASIRF